MTDTQITKTELERRPLISFSRKGRTYFTGYMFVLPALLFLLIFIVYPVVQSLYLSFYKWDGFSDKVFIGIKNYISIFNDKNFILALQNSIVYIVVSSILILLVGFTLAIIIDNKLKGWKAYRFIYFLPTMLSFVVVALLWHKIYDPRVGLINKLLEFLHLDILKQQWLADPKIALYCIIGIVIWQWSGLFMVFFLAAMAHIDETIYEAARIDGVNTFGRIFRITLPMIKDQFIIIAIILLIASVKVFDIVWVTTQGGPAGSTHVLGTYLYLSAFRFNRVGYASVIAVIALAISLVFAAIYINYDKLTSRRARKP
jgi:ABC-type sugar transport system permease subunit